jgi:putative cardiolipin synthase
LRPLQNDVQEITVAEAAEIYFSLLAGFKGNRHIQTRISITGREGFAESRSKMRAGLREMKGLSSMSKALSAMPEYTSSGFIQSEVLLAHEFGNLVNKRVVTRALENQVKNPNSIMGMMRGLDTNDDKELTIVSPYLFMARYYDREGTVTLDEADELKRWLEADPDRVLNIVTNSVLTSDNFFAQAIVDMNMAPRMLLDDEDTMQAWLGKRQDGEQNVQLVESQVWLELVNNPRLRVYETGRLDDELLGGPQSYGKLHAKYFFSDDVGFVGTANFDYRSRLYNNEMGFFFRSPELLAYLKEDFELLRSKSYLWGSPEWLEMRNEVMGLSGMKGMTTRKQRSFYRFLKSTGLYWLF